MQRIFVRNLVIIVIGILVLGGGSLTTVRLTTHANMNPNVALRDTILPVLKKAAKTQSTDPHEDLDLSVGLQVRNQDQLDSLLQDIYNPDSPRYHQFLTPGQFKDQFAPTDDQVHEVEQYLKNQGLEVTNVASNNLIVNAHGTVSQTQNAFHTQINNYRLDRRVFHANENPPSVPQSLSSIISSVSGLENSQQYHPLMRQLPAKSQKAGRALDANGYTPNDIASAYDIAPLHNANILGDNQTVALVELDTFNQSDINQYAQTYNLGTPNISTVQVDNAPTTPGIGSIEAAIDIEVMMAVAPHANQIVYQGPNSTAGINDLYNKIITDNRAQIVSIGWGQCEASQGAAELNTLDTILKQGVAQGMGFYAASGDSGAYDCSDNNLAVDFPASDPNVTGVGGTNLQLNSDGSYAGETAWSNSSNTKRSPKGAGSGGGISKTYKQPSWQTGNGVQNSYSNGNRQVPDVSADADEATGYAIYCTVAIATCSSSGWNRVAGTSAATPIWAGSMALVNQYLQSQNQVRIGTANSALYKLFNTPQTFAPYHDITSGDNLYYPTTNGYDLSTGIGTPDVYDIARDLAHVTTGGPGTAQPTPQPTTGPTISLLPNGGFENGQKPWQESSGMGYQMVDQSTPHTGQYSAYMCGYMGCMDRLWQSFTLPTTFNKVVVTYWWYSDTGKTSKTCDDTLKTRLQVGSDLISILDVKKLLKPLQSICNTDAANKWVQVSYDATKELQNYKGQTVSLVFEGTNLAGQFQSTDFFIDDVSVTAQ